MLRHFHRSSFLVNLGCTRLNLAFLILNSLRNLIPKETDTKNMAVYVGKWDCPTCGNIGVAGPETNCTNCGASRPEDVQFYLDDETVIRDKSQLEEAQAGVDWICGHCSSQNKALADPCWSCGNPRDVLSEDVDLE